MRAPSGADRQAQHTEGADDFGAHVRQLALQREQPLIGHRLLIGVPFQLFIAVIAIDGLGVRAELLVDHGLVVDRGRIVRTLLLGVLELLQRRVEIVLGVEEASAGEQLVVVLIGLPFLL